MFQAHEHHNFLHQFPHGWPVEEFITTYLKNKCSYACKQGYLPEMSNQRLDQHDEEEQEQEEQEQEERQGGKGKGKEREIRSEIEDADVSDDMYGSDVPV